MKFAGKILTLITAASLVGCNGQFDSMAVLQDVDQGKIDKKSERPACEIQTAEYALDTRMIAFEMTSNTGVSFGFDVLAKFLKLFSAEFRVKSGRLSLGMSLYDPMKPQSELVNVLGSSTMWGREFAFDFSVYQVGVGFNHYSKTPIATLAERGLDDTLNRLTGRMSKLQDAWSTQVVALPTETEFVVPVGAFTGLKVGDDFAIYNVEHVWAGEPCHSEHLIARKTTPYPIVIATVIQLENNAALLSIKSKDEYAEVNNLKVEKGALVEVHQLTDPKRKLFRTLEIREVIGAEMQFENSTVLDLTPHLQNQIKAVANRHGFVIRSAAP